MTLLLLNLLNVLSPQGFYKGGKFVFSFKVSNNWIEVTAASRKSTFAEFLFDCLCLCVCLCARACAQVGQGYPHDPPKVKCDTMVYHPNIDLEGNVCLNILRSAEQCMQGGKLLIHLLSDNQLTIFTNDNELMSADFCF